MRFTFIKSALVTVAIAASLYTQGEKYQPLYLETPTYGYANMELSIPTNPDLTPTKHTVNGSTVINVDYEGKVDIRVKAAFEYACRFWEECLPSVPAIRIKVSTAPLQSDTENPMLSKVSLLAFKTENDEYPDNRELLSPLSRIKAINFLEHREHNQFTEITENSDILNSYDFEIVYNRDYVSKFSYDVEKNGSNSSSTFDFTTLAIRDIAKGLGMMCAFEADNAKKTMLPLNRFPLPFEYNIKGSLGYDYATFTQEPGSCVISSANGWNLKKLSVFTSKSGWETGTSLSGFMPYQKTGFANALSYAMTHSSYIRRIADIDFPRYLAGYIGWMTVSTVGIHSDAVANETLIINPGDDINQILSTMTEDKENNSSNVVGSTVKAISHKDWEINELYAKYRIPTIGTNQSHTYLHLLKKDGSWNTVATSIYIKPEWDIETAIANEDISTFARDADGNIRGVAARYDYSFFPDISTSSSICSFGARPDVVELDVANYTYNSSGNRHTVIIGFKNAEGTEKIRFKECIKDISGNTITSEFSTENIDKRIIVRNYGNAVTVTLTPYASNEYGETEGKEFSFKLFSTPPIVPVIKVNKENISFKVANMTEESSYPFRISEYNDFSSKTLIEGEYTNNYDINISDLTSGSYILNYMTGDNEWKSLKFQKQ